MAVMREVMESKNKEKRTLLGAFVSGITVA